MEKGYKYRGCKELERDLNSLCNNQIYAPPFLKLNDPFEAAYSEEITSLLRSLQQQYNVDTTTVNHHFNNIKNYASQLGIYSLSLTYSNAPMWAHYASNHEGFCIEYEIDRLKDNILNTGSILEFEVDYQEEVPLVDYKDIKSGMLIKKMFATKSLMWSYEKEVRLIFDTYSLKNYHPSALTGIYFGLNSSEDLKQRFINALIGKDVKFYSVNKSSNKYGLERKLIHENRRQLKNQLNDQDYEILKTKHGLLIENFYILYKNSNLEHSSIKNFLDAFKEKYASKECNIYLFDDKRIIPLIGKYPLSMDEYLEYADHLIALLNSSSPDEISWYPYQDYRYKEYGGRNFKKIPIL